MSLINTVSVDPKKKERKKQILDNIRIGVCQSQSKVSSKYLGLYNLALFFRPHWQRQHMLAGIR